MTVCLSLYVAANILFCGLLAGIACMDEDTRIAAILPLLWGMCSATLLVWAL